MVQASTLNCFINRNFKSIPKNVIVINDLSINTELDAKAPTEIVGSGEYILSTSWKCLGTSYYFKQWVKKQGQWYKRYLRVRKYRRTQYEYQTAYVDL